MITNREKLADFIAEKLYDNVDVEEGREILDLSQDIQSYLKEFEEHNQMAIIVVDRSSNVRS